MVGGILSALLIGLFLLDSKKTECGLSSDNTALLKGGSLAGTDSSHCRSYRWWSVEQDEFPICFDFLSFGRLWIDEWLSLQRELCPISVCTRLLMKRVSVTPRPLMATSTSMSTWPRTAAASAASRVATSFSASTPALVMVS